MLKLFLLSILVVASFALGGTIMGGKSDAPKEAVDAAEIEKEWTHEQKLWAKQSCYVASQLEKLTFDFVPAEGMEGYLWDFYTDLYCSCKAGSISETEDFEDYQMNAARIDMKWIASQSNKNCIDQAMEEVEKSPLAKVPVVQ